MRFVWTASAFAIAALVGSQAGAVPNLSPKGRWDRDDGRGGIKIVPCGRALCGDIVWLSDSGGPAHVGQRVLFNMQQTASNTWSGRAMNPEDGQNYSGSMTLTGAHLSTQGCALGGMICKTVELSRPR